MNVAPPTPAPTRTTSASTEAAARGHRATTLRQSIEANLDLILAAALALATAALYARCGRFGFVNFDDGAYVWSNPDLPLGLTWAGLRYAFTAHNPYWHPLVWIINLAVYSRFGVRPGPYHVVNICFHAAAAGLLLLFWVRATGNRWAAVMAAALWAWHPLRVESVAWISETKDASAVFFWIVAMLLYLGYVRRPSIGRYAAVTAAYAAALCCKPSVVTFPFALLLLDVWPLRRSPMLHRRSEDNAAPARPMDWPALLVEKLPWLAMAAIVSCVSYIAQRNGRAMTGGSSLPVSARIEHALVCYLWYLGKTFWPTRLAIFYPHPYMLNHVIPAWHWLWAVVVLLAITLAALALWRWHPAVSVGWLWFVGTFVPMIGLVQVGLQGMADRHTLIPSIGLTAAIVFPLGAILRHRSAAVRWMAGIAVAVLLACELVATSIQIGYWRDTTTAFAHAYAVVPDNFLAAAILAQQYAQTPATLPQAMKLAQWSVQVAPTLAMSHQALAGVYDAEDDYADSLRELEKAAHLNPTDVQGCDEVGREQMRRGRYDRSLLWYETALKINPSDVTARHNVALCLAHEGHLDQAIAIWRQVLARHPAFDAAHTRLAEALQREGDLHAAAQHYQAAVALGEKDPTVEANDAWCVATDPLSTPEQVQNVLPVAKNAVDQTAHKDPLALDAWAAALARAGQFDQAESTARAAAALAASKPALAHAIEARAADYRAGKTFLIYGR